MMISCLRGVAQLIHTRAEEGGLGTAVGKQKKMKKSKDSVQRAIKIAENAKRNHAHMILDITKWVHQNLTKKENLPIKFRNK